MTKQTARLLEALLSELGRDWYGLELMDRAELRSGTAYPLLHRLQADGWLTSSPEEMDPHLEGRPRRRLYRLTGLGQAEAVRLLEARQRQARVGVSPPALKPRGVTP
jgi:PadR family transcriptional regulator PadR